MSFITAALDIETSKSPCHFPWISEAFPVSIGYCDDQGLKKTWILNHQEKGVINQNKVIKDIQQHIDRCDRLVGHNFKFDLGWFHNLGLDFSNCRVFCTMIGAYLLSGQEEKLVSLDTLAEKYGIEKKLDKVKVFWEAGYNTDEIPLKYLIPYGIRDCEITLEVFKNQEKEIARHKGMGRLMWLHMSLMKILTNIEVNGMFANKDRALQYIAEHEKLLKEKDHEAKNIFGFDINLSSSDDLSAGLYGGLVKRPGKKIIVYTKNHTIKEPYLFTYKSGRKKIKYRNKTIRLLTTKQVNEVEQIQIKGIGFIPNRNTETKKEGYFKTDKSTITNLKATRKDQKRVKELLIERSVLNKVLETFRGKSGSDRGLINKIQKDGCVHPKFNQTVTKTGRLSSSDPNGQNLPRKGTSPIKMIFVPRYPGWVIANADLGQVEWRVAGYLSQDPVIINELESGFDYHRDNAIKFFSADSNLDNDHKNFKPLRTLAKIFGFRLLYGGTVMGFVYDPMMPKFSRSKWQNIINAYYTKYARLAEWQNECITQVYNTGKLILPSGRILKFPENPTGPARYNDRNIKNYPVQALSFDVVAVAMYYIWLEVNRYKLKSKMICQVHDSIVFDGPKEETYQLNRICIGVFQNLPKILSKLWGINFNVPLTGDFEIGDSYGNLKPFKGSIKD